MFKKMLAGVLCMALLAMNSQASQRVVSHVTRADSPFETVVVLENTSTESKVYSLLPFQADGSALDSLSGELAPGESRAISTADLGGASHFAVDAHGDVAASATYFSVADLSVGAEVDAVDAATAWQFKGDARSHFEALAIVNAGEISTPVWLHQRNAEGQIVASEKLADLAPNAKTMTVIGRDNLKTAKGNTFEIIADQHLAVTVLRGNENGQLNNRVLNKVREAESSRDQLGIWTITGGSLGDVFEMMGYNVATDRMWQGEVLRRTGSGRLAEIFGPSFVGQDTQVRTTGFSSEELQAAYEEMSDESKTVIDSYVAGFNRRIAEIRQDPTLMPFEFLALGMSDIADWTREDVIAWSVTLQFNFTSSFGALYQIFTINELQYLINKYGPFRGASMYNDLLWINDPSAAAMDHTHRNAKRNAKTQNQPLPILKAGLPDFTGVAERMAAEQERNIELLQSVGAYYKGGSYAWVVGGERTESGNPILYSGPQLESARNFQAPAIVQEGTIRGGGLNVSGLNVTGVPAIIVGRTKHHAWSFQVGHANSQDLYIESPASIISQRLETIKVAGGEDVIIPVVHTANGPVINESPVIAFKTTLRDYVFGFVDATLGLARARSMDEFGEAVEKLAVSMHICYADVDSNIAYWHSGKEPVRPHGEWRLPQGAVAAPLAWDSSVLEPIVNDRNTSRGYYGGWNNKSTASWDDKGGSHRFGTWHFENNITSVLDDMYDMTYDDVVNLAPRISATASSIAFAGIPWNFYEPYAREFIEANPTPERLEALELMDSWDRVAVAGGPEMWPYSLDYQDAWALQDQWLLRILPKIFADEFDNPQLFGSNAFMSRTNMMLHMLDPENTLNVSYNFFSNRSDASAPQTAEEIFIEALDEALAAMGERPWAVGARPLTSYNHPLFGDLTEVVPELATPFSNRATWAQVVEYGPDGPVRAGSHFLLGQSGHVGFDAEGMPVLNPLNFAMMPYFISFQMWPSTLFED